MQIAETDLRQKNLMDAIYGRVSVRSYTGRPLDRVTIHTLLSAAVRAPTAIHLEPWAFVVVQSQKILERLSDRTKSLFVAEVHRGHLDRGGHSFEKFSSPDFDVFYGAGTLIVICARSSSPFVAADCWLAAENLMLAAHAMGFGTCVIGSALSALNTPEAKAELGIPIDVTPYAPIVLGVPRGETPTSPRKEPEILAWR